MFSGGGKQQAAAKLKAVGAHICCVTLRGAVVYQETMRLVLNVSGADVW